MYDARVSVLCSKTVTGNSSHKVRSLRNFVFAFKPKIKKKRVFSYFK